MEGTVLLYKIPILGSKAPSSGYYILFPATGSNYKYNTTASYLQLLATFRPKYSSQWLKSCNPGSLSTGTCVRGCFAFTHVSSKDAIFHSLKNPTNTTSFGHHVNLQHIFHQWNASVSSLPKRIWANWSPKNELWTSLPVKWDMPYTTLYDT